MSGDSKNKSFLESLVLDDSEKGVVITGIKDDTIAAKSGLQAGDEIVAATIHLDHLNKNEVLNILKVLEPYDDNMKVLTKKQLGASAGLGSLGLDLEDPAKMLNLKKELSLDASAEAPVVSLDGLSGKLNAPQGLGGEIGSPTLNGDLPSLTLNKPSADGGTKVTMPSLGLTGPDIQGDLDGTLTAPDVNVSTPKLNTPSASLDIEKPGFKKADLKYKAPKFTMPHFSLPQLKTPKAEMDVSGDVDLPSASGNLETPDLNLSAPKLNLESPDMDLNGPKVDLNGPDINFETPNVDIEAPSSKIKWPHLKWRGPKVKGPDADLNADLSAPDFSLNTTKIDGDLSAPDIDIKSPDLDVQTPDLDIDAPSGRINWPHFKWKKPKHHGPKANLDLDANLNTPCVDPSLPKVEGGINAPDVDINLPKADLKGPDLDVQTPNIDVDVPSGKINWPHLKWKKSKFQGPNPDIDIDADLTTPDLNVSTPKIEGDINVPNAELNLPEADLDGPNVDLDIDGPSGKINWPHLKWKKPKLHGPKADMDLNADLSTPDVDLSVPKTDGEINAPDVDLNLTKADVDVKAPDAGKIRFPTLKRPKFLLSGPKVKGPEVDLDADVKAPDLSLSPQASLDGPDVDLNLHKADIDVKAPNADIEAQSGFKWPTLKKPKWSTSGLKVNGLDADLDADVSAFGLSTKAPKIDGELNASDVNLNLPKADLEGPELDINPPDVEGSGKLKWFKKTFGTLRGPKGDIDADVKVPDLDLKANAPKIEANIKGPDVDLNGPDIDPDIDSPNGKLNFPKFKLPPLKAPKAKGPELDANLKTLDIDTSLDLPTPNVDLKASDLDMSTPKMGLDAPDLDINLPKADLKGPDVHLQAPEVDASAGKLPKINLPKFGFLGPKVKGPNIDVDADNVSFPNVNLESPTADTKVPNLNLSTPTIEGDLSTPALDLPKTDFHVHDLKLKEPNLSLSSPNIDGNLSAPNIDTKLPKTDLEAPVTLNAPNVDINLPKADLKGPEAKFKKTDLDFDSHLGDFNMPHFKLPTLGLSSPDVEVPSVHPSGEVGIEAPKVNIGTPVGNIDGPKAPNVDANLEKSKLSHLKFPKLSLPGHKMKTAEVNTSVEGGISSPDVSVSAPEVKTSLKTPELDITADTEAEGKSKLRWPFKWGLKSGSGTEPDEEGSGIESETDVTNAEMEVPVFKIHRLPRNSLDSIGGIEDVLSLSKFDTESKDYVVSKGVRLPIVNATSKTGEKIDVMERLKIAKEKASSTNVSPTEAKTDIDLKLAAPSLDGSASTEGDSSFVRGGTFKVEKPEAVLGLVAPEISTSDENDKMSLSLSNMLGLNIKDSDDD